MYINKYRYDTLMWVVVFFFTVVHEYDYVFAENGLVAYKEGKQIGQEVRMSTRSFN